MSQSGKTHKVDMLVVSNLLAYPYKGAIDANGMSTEERRGDIGTGMNTGSANQDLNVKGGDFASDGQKSYRVDSLLKG